MKINEEEMLKNTLSTIKLKYKTLTVISKQENLQKLKNLIENGNNKLINLADQWNEIQTPLLEEYKTLQNSLSNEDLQFQEKQSKLKKLQDVYDTLNTNLKEKIQLEADLKQKLGQMNKNHNRLMNCLF